MVVGSDVVIFHVTDRVRFDPAEFEHHRDETRDELAAQRPRSAARSIIAERRDSMEITYDPQMSEKLGLTG